MANEPMSVVRGSQRSHPTNATHFIFALHSPESFLHSARLIVATISQQNPLWVA